MEAPDPRPLLGLAAALVLAGEVVGVGLGQRQRHVPALEPGQDALLVVAGLVPGAEHERSRRARLTADVGGQPAQDVRGARTGEHPQAQLARLYLRAPGAAPVAAEAEQALLAVVEQHPVPGAGEQPGHGEVGGVRARAKAPGRHEARDQRALVGLERPLGHVVLHLVAALVDGVRALAEAQVALARASAEGDAHAPDLGEARPGDDRAQGDHTVPGGPQPHAQPAPRRVARGEEQLSGAPPGHARGVKPAGPGGKAQTAAGAATRSRGLGQHRRSVAHPRTGGSSGCAVVRARSSAAAEGAAQRASSKVDARRRARTGRRP